MSPVNVEERLRALRDQALGREPAPDAWPRLQRRLRREPWRRTVLVAGLVLAVLAGIVAPGLLARRTGQPPAPTLGTPVVPGRPVVAARIRLDRPFSDVDVGFGAIWVAGQDGLLRVDLRTNRVVATIPVPLAGRYASVAFGEGAVWMTSGEADGVVYRVDPASNRVTARIGVPGGAFGIVVAAGIVWVTQYLPERDPGVVARIDARTGRLRSPIEIPHLPGAIRYGLDAIWVTSRFTVSRIDPRRGTVTQPLHRVGDVMAVGGGALWGTFANSADDAGVQRIDPATGRVVATITIPHGVVMAFGLGTLWVAQDASTIMGTKGEPDRTRPGRLYRIDPTSNRVLGRPVPLPGIAPTALAVGEGAILVGELDGTTLTRFNLVP
jgi:DNA-binding beta-propeller fold protein YncE